MTNLRNLLLKKYKLYLMFNENDDNFYKINNKQKKSLNLEYLKYFNIDPQIVFDNIESIYSIIKNDDNIYKIFFPRYGEPVSVPDADIE